MKLKYGILILVGISLIGLFVIGFDYGLPEETWPETIGISNSSGFVVIEINPENFPTNGTLIPHATVDLPPGFYQEEPKLGFNNMRVYLDNSSFTSNESLERLKGEILLFRDIESVYVIIPKGAVVEGSIGLIPEEITVVIGINNTITWINEDDTPHAITSDYADYGWGTYGVLKPGESYRFTFSNPGVFPYHMEPHPWVTGTVIVLEI